MKLSIGVDRCILHSRHIGRAARLLPFMLWQLRAKPGAAHLLPAKCPLICRFAQVRQAALQGLQQPSKLHNLSTRAPLWLCAAAGCCSPGTVQVLMTTCCPNGA